MPPQPRPRHTECEAVLDPLTESCARVERRFQTIGGQLEQALGSLGRLHAAFAQAQSEWAGADAGRAAQDLSHAVAQVSAVGDLYQDGGAALHRLRTLGADTARCAARMLSPTEHIDILAVNARLSAASLSGGGGAFLVFAEQVRRLANQARMGVVALRGGLARLGGQIEAAGSAQGGFNSAKWDAIRSVPGRIDAALRLVQAGARQAAAAAAEAGRRSHTMQASVIAAVQAMQIGDITRQRIEHVQRIAELLAAQAAGGAEPPAQVAAVAWRIGIAQLHDTADELDAEAARIDRLLRALAAQAGEVARLGASAFGADNQLGVLQGEVRDTCAALASLQVACTAADDTVAEVQRLAAGLEGQIATLRGIEADIRLMGLNTTLRSGRLGMEGRPLSVIAQMLRETGGQLTAAADATRTGIGDLMAEATSLADPRRREAVAAIAPLSADMTGATERLARADGAMLAALEQLDRETAELTRRLEASLRDFTAHDDIAGVLRRAAAGLDLLLADAAPPPDGPAHDALLDAIAAGYTMARERVVHGRVTGVPVQSEPAPGTDDLDCLLL